MQQGIDLTIGIVFGAGMLSFLSPCTLPIFPAYLSYITGMSVKELQEHKDINVQARLLLHAVFFLSGVSMVFLGLGIGVTLFGQWLQDILSGHSGILLQRMAGIFIIMMGLFVGGWLKIMPLMKDTRKRFKNKPTGLIGSFFIGIGFAAGWTPCIGPIFASVLVIATSNPTQGAIYTIIYIIGFALPFLIFTFFLSYAKWLVRYTGIITRVGGAMMLLFGMLLFTGQLAKLSNFLLKIIQDTWLSNLG
ncbi:MULTISPECIES: cytochrome c biogenesis CcdA family protein [Paraliobacillus]|uniref:cytochrome c biogenesis CcdA family protein n=1 Tax=Paraliobacillus TaxID=200903 RepID=UPI000DD40DF7|nr:MULTISPECIES: cytochrome c biogenesis protein CcdA [Paraliobacillus]